MLRNEFEISAPGSLVAIEGGLAFLPAPLPVEIPVTRGLLAAAGRARGALGEFVGEVRLLENPSLITHPLAIREAVLSNKIEGTHTVVSDVLLQKAGSPAKDPAQRERQREVLDYFRASALGAEKIQEGWPLGLPLIRALHQELMGGATRFQGGFRLRQVYIGQEYENLARSLELARFVPPPYEHVPALMDNFEEVAAGEASYDPLIDIAILHYQFETIHPFEDGNGRMGRLLIPIYLMAQKVIDKPYLYLSSYLEPHKDRYVRLMKEVSARGVWEDWILFFLEAVRAVADESKSRVRTVLRLQSDYRARVRSATTTQAPFAAIDLVMSQAYVTVRDVQDYVRCANNTARNALEVLTKFGVVEPQPNTYPQVWAATELLRSVYDT